MQLAKWLLCFPLIPFFCLHHIGLGAAAAQAPVVANAARSLPGSMAASGLLTQNLMARDKEGRPVTDLKSDELHLFVDKLEQEIHSLSPARNEPLTIGLFFDISGSRRADQHVGEEARLAGELVHSVWREGDTAFLVAGNSPEPGLKYTRTFM
jgi:hypothetical protein